MTTEPNQTATAEVRRAKLIALGWEVSKTSLYDEEGVEGWRWTSPEGQEYSEIGQWDEPVPLPDTDLSFLDTETVEAAAEVELLPREEEWRDVQRKNMETRLEPCPFCGNAPTLTNVRMSNHTFRVGCYNENCGVRPARYENLQDRLVGIGAIEATDE